MARGCATTWSVTVSLLMIVLLSCQVKCEESAAPISTPPRNLLLPGRGSWKNHGIATRELQHREPTSTSFPIASSTRSGGRTRRSRSLLAAADGANFTYTAGGEVMTAPITVFFIWLGPWAESSKSVIRTAFRSLASGSGSGSSQNLPTLEGWWEVVREVRNASTGLPVTDTITVGEECVYDPGQNATVTEALVLETVHRAFNASTTGGGALNCSGAAPLVPQAEDAVYYLVVSRELQTDPAAINGNLTCGCSGPLDLRVGDTPVKLVWSKKTFKQDYCNFWSQRTTPSFLPAPNGDPGLDTLVSTMLAQLAEIATAPYRQQDGLSISEMCPGPDGADEQLDSQPYISDAKLNTSYNVVGLNGTRYMVQHLWSVENGNCILQPSDSCEAVVESQAGQGRLQYGLIVDGSFGLQPCRPNLNCRWRVSVDRAKFILIRIQYMATADDEPLIVHSPSCPGPAINLDGNAWMRLTGSAGFQHSSRKLLAVVGDGDNGLPQPSFKESSGPDSSANGCSASVAGLLYDLGVDVVVRGSYMEIEYITPVSVDPRSNGWIIQYEAGYCEGQETVRNHTGAITDGSPEGQMYGKGLSCSWVLLGKPDTSVALNFTRINTVNESDFVAIYKGASINVNSVPIQKFFGNFTDQLPQITTLGPMVVVFTTTAGGGSGWEATFRISDPDVGRGSRWTKPDTAGLTAAVVGAAFILALGAMLCWYTRKRLQGGDDTVLDLQALPLFKLNAAKKCVFSQAQLFKATEGFSQRNLVAQSGRAGLLYRGTLADGTVVTIKRPASNEFNSSNRELEILAGMAHENVVGLVGYSSNPVGRILVLEHMENGSLRDALLAVSQDSASTSSLRQTALLSWELRLKIAIQIARGLEYLHLYADPCIIHRNVKSSNVLLDSAWVPHISGFHQAVFCVTGDRVELLNDRQWPASSSFSNTSSSLHASQTSTTIHASKAGDIFGFGLLLLEILTGRQLQDSDTSYSDHTKYHQAARAVPLIESGEGLSILDPRLPVPSNAQALLKLADIAVWCLLPSSMQRPTIVEVVKGLEQVIRLFQLSRSTRVNSAKLYPQQ